MLYYVKLTDLSIKTISRPLTHLVLQCVRSFWSRSLRSGTLRSRSFGSEAKFGHFGRGHYGPGHFGRGHFYLYFRH